MNEPVKQHYVPKTYMENFDNGFSKFPHVYALTVSDGKILNVATRKTSAENHFYTLHRYSKDKDTSEKYFWENYYARVVEPELGNLLKRTINKCESALIQNNALVLSSYEKEMFAWHLHTQLLRGKHARMFAKTIYDKHLLSIIDGLKKIIPPSETARWGLIESFRTDDNLFLETSMDAILHGTNTDRFLDIVLERSFVIFRVFHNATFMTSDHPVSFVNLLTHNATPFKNGLVNPSTLVMFPLSPSLLLCAFHPDYYCGLYNNWDCRLRFIETSAQQALVEYSNLAQMDQCNRFVYSSSEEALITLHCNRFAIRSSLPFLL